MSNSFIEKSYRKVLLLYFFPGLFFIFFRNYAHCSCMVVWGFGVGVSYWVFGVGVLMFMRFGACGVGTSGFFGFELSI